MTSLRTHSATVRSALSLSAAFLAALATLAALAAAAQPPIKDTSVDALVRALEGGPATRAFRRTAVPEAGSNLCAAQAAPVATGSAGSTTRNLEVVPYAGDTTPGLDLSVQFALASDQLTAPDRALLDKLATALQRPELAQDRFAVVGHTDSTGDARVNLELSCARAMAVRRYLAGKGVAEERLSAYGFGSTRLLADAQATSGMQRRVEFRKAPE